MGCLTRYIAAERTVNRLTRDASSPKHRYPVRPTRRHSQLISGAFPRSILLQALSLTGLARCQDVRVRPDIRRLGRSDRVWHRLLTAAIGSYQQSGQPIAAAAWSCMTCECAHYDSRQQLLLHDLCSKPPCQLLNVCWAFRSPATGGIQNKLPTCARDFLSLFLPDCAW
jgi:hypothetical protein